MLTLQTRTQANTGDIQAGLQRLAPSLSRTVAETAGAFFMAEASLPLNRAAIPRFSDFDAMRCSQKNIGEKYEMICNLAVDRAEWNGLFVNGEPEDLRRDAYSELVNCICGAVLAYSGFTEEYGYLIPCVPCSGPALVPAGASRLKGAFKMGTAWIRFSISMLQTTRTEAAGRLAAVA